MEAFTVDAMSAIGTKQQDARTAVAAVAEFERGQQHNVNDEEEDVDVYLNRMNDSNKPSPGSHRSPGGYFAVTQYRQRRSPSEIFIRESSMGVVDLLSALKFHA